MSRPPRPGAPSPQSRDRRPHWRWRDPLDRLRRVFQHRSQRPALDAEVDEEIRYHLTRTEQELVRGGYPEPEARREAQRRFGDVEAHRRRLRRINRSRGRRETMRSRFEASWHTLRTAASTLRSSPWVTATVVVTLALGIGANAVMFGIVDRLLLRAPDHIVAPEQVARIAVRRTYNGESIVNSVITYPDFRDWESARGFDSIAVWGSSQMTIGYGEEAERVPGRRVSPTFMPLLGVRPLHGRFFTPEEDAAGAAVVVLGHEFWNRRYGGDPAVVGDLVDLEGTPYEIIGVAPEGFTGTELDRVDLWMPLRSPSMSGDAPAWENHRGWYWLHPVGRIADGGTFEAAGAEATALHRAARADDERYDPEADVLVRPIIAGLGVGADPASQDGNAVVVTQWLAGVALVVLLIACANVANILLAASLRRRREVGIRLALGISARRLLAQLTCEAVLLSLLGGVAALVIARWGSGLVRSVMMPDVHWVGSPVDGRVMAFTFAVAVLAGLFAGLGPALHAYRQDLSAVLAGGARAGGRQRSRLRTGMLVVQTSLSVVLLVGAGLFVRSLSNVQAIDHGFELEGTLMIDPELDPAIVPREQVNDFMTRAMTRLTRLPLVEGATSTVAVPFWSAYASRLEVPDVPEPPVFAAGGPYTNPVAPEYFRTMGIDLRAGREFGAADYAEGAAPVAIVDETFASAYWPGQEPLGKCLKIGQDEPPCAEVIGVVEDTARSSLLPDEVAQYYVPVTQQAQWRLGTLMLRVDPDRMPTATDAVFREIVAMEGVRFARVMPLQEAADPQARSWRLGASMFTLFGVLALVIASVGLYGVLAFDVAQRTHEIGVRAALGATTGKVMRLVLRNAMTVIAASVVIGVLVARVAAAWLEELLYEVGPGDPLVLALVVAVLVAVAVLASAVPAWRASRVDPVIALRQE